MAPRTAVGRRLVFSVAAVFFAASAGLSQDGAPSSVPEPTRYRPRPAAAPRRRTLSRPQVMNVIDEALYELAELRLAAERYADAVAVLQELADATPDAETRSVTFFNLGVIHQDKLDDAPAARAFFARVTGRMAGTARRRILAPLRREKDWAESVEFLKECLEHATESADRAAVVRQLIHTVRSSGDEELTESVLSSVPGMITYEDAQKEAEARRARMEEARIEQRRSRQERGVGADRADRARRERAEKAKEAKRKKRGQPAEAPKRWRKKPRPSLEPPPPVGRGQAAGEGDEDRGDAAEPEL